MLRTDMKSTKIQRAKLTVENSGLEFRSEVNRRHNEQDRKNQDSLLSLAPNEAKCFKEGVANVAERLIMTIITVNTYIIPYKQYSN